MNKLKGLVLLVKDLAWILILCIADRIVANGERVVDTPESVGHP